MNYKRLTALPNLFLKTFRSNKTFAWLVSVYGAVSLLLFFYSFTQIDLNLILVSHPFIHAIQKPFIYIGYFQRTLSMSFFLILLLSFFSLFLLTLRSITRKTIGKREVIMIITVVTAILFLSYPSFSHDIFNYMFDAKIFTEYGDNPYLMRAIDYPQDPWIQFMHWTHRTYPYGPVFLPISIALSFLSFNIFPITLVFFKALMIFSYVGTTYLIYKIVEKTAPPFALASAAFFALNPLVIFETIVSSHHDLVMMFLAFLAVYLFLLKKKVLSFILFLLSVGIKYVSLSMAPLYLLGFHPVLLFLGSVAATTTVMLKLGIQPWYLLWALPFAALLYKYKFVRILAIVTSFVFMLRYLPFLLFGEWSAELLQLHNSVTVISVLGASMLFVLWKFFFKKRLRLKNNNVSI